MNFTNTDSVKNCIWYQMDDQVYNPMDDQVFDQISPIKYKID